MATSTPDSEPDASGEPSTQAAFTFIEQLPAPAENRPAFKQGQRPPPHKDTVRAGLAVAVMALLFVVTIVGVLVWVFQANRDMRDYLILITPITSLAGAIVGFYFAQQQPD